MAVAEDTVEQHEELVEEVSDLDASGEIEKH